MVSSRGSCACPCVVPLAQNNGGDEEKKDKEEEEKEGESSSNVPIVFEEDGG